VLLYIKSRLLATGTKPDSDLIEVMDFLLRITIPGCVMKQFVNVAQLCTSCYAIAEHDAKERAKKD
jgi:hypothetical protein